MSRPLEGIKVLEFTFGGAAPLATKIMGDFGADVVKIESLTRVDWPRVLPPFAKREPGINRSAYFTNRNSSKRSVELDLKKPDAVSKALRLASVADVVISNFRSGVMEKLGLGYHDIVRQNHELIYVSMPMISGAGPAAGYRGSGRNISAISGMHALTGYSPTEIMGPGTHFPDHAANPGHALLVVMAALIHRDRTGRGCFIELAQVNSTLQLLGPSLMLAAATGHVPSVRGNFDPVAAPYGVFQCGPGDAWIAVAIRTDAQWRALAHLAGRTELLDERFRTVPGRLKHRDELHRELSRWLADQPSHFAVADRLQAAGVPAAPVEDARELVDEDPFVRQSGFLVALDHPEMGPVTYNAPPYRYVDRSEPRMRRAPLLGEHTGEVLVEWLNSC